MNPSAFVLGWRVLLIPVPAVLPSLSRHFGESSPAFGLLSKRGVLWSLFQSQYLLGGNTTKAMGGMGVNTSSSGSLCWSLLRTVRRGDVLAAWSGIRPLVTDPNSKDTQSISRNHVVTISDSGLVTIAGTLRSLTVQLLWASPVSFIQNVSHCKTILRVPTTR